MTGEDNKPNDIRIREEEKQADVIVFGKDPKLEAQDSINGISRFGGFLREPDYLFAYYQGSKVLLEQAIQNKVLDDLGLPIIFLQRHTTELLLKRLLSWSFDIAKYIESFNEVCPWVPTAKQKKNFGRSHDLGLLFNDLEQAVNAFGFEPVPSYINDLVSKLKEIERTTTFLRYDSSLGQGEQRIHHMKDEVVVPIVDLQGLLEKSVNGCIYRGFANSDNVYEAQLYRRLLPLAERAGDAGYQKEG